MGSEKRTGGGVIAPVNTLIKAEARGADAPLARSADIDQPIEGECAARVGAPTAPVLDEDKMSKFVALMGSEWVAKNLRKFAMDVERRLASLDTATASELGGIAHGMIMMAAQCGFTELLNVSEVVQREAREGAGLNRITELRDAGDRALVAMRSLFHSQDAAAGVSIR